MTTPVIHTENLTKVFKTRERDVLALDSLSLDMREGEIFGYLGPNGAGKTTTIRLLLDIIRPTAGRATVLGMDAQADAVELHRHIGFLPGELNLWRGLTGRQVIDYIARLRGGADMAYVRQLADELEFDMSLRVRNYSSGNKRKLGLIIAMMNRPPLLILDEPTNGLDPLMQQIFNRMMRAVRDEGRTVFLSSHVLSEVQAICDRVGILRSGQLKAVERVADLTHARFRWVTLRFNEQVPAAVVAGVPGVSEISENGLSLRFQLAGDFDPLLRAVSPYYVADMRVEEPTLEEIFLAFYGNGAAVERSAMQKEMVQS
jgi:ABC-2 type transport system ATP-binding protein